MNHLINKFLQFFVLLNASFFASSAMAWLFILPGSLTNAIADAITGEEGFHCVARSVQVGDRIKTGTGPGIVKSLSGESNRCSTNLNKPIRGAVFIQPIRFAATAVINSNESAPFVLLNRIHYFVKRILTLKDAWYAQKNIFTVDVSKLSVS